MPEDHRTRTGQHRSSQMRLRLMEAGLAIVAEGGQTNLTIDAVIAKAGIARGSFYTHFKRPQELLTAIGFALSEEIIRLVNPTLRDNPDPAARLGSGVMMILALVQQYPVIGRFIARSGWPDVPDGHVFHALVGASIKEGMISGRFLRVPDSIVFNLVVGTIIGSMFTMTETETPADHPRQIAAALLRALGIGREEAQDLATLQGTLPTLDASGLLSRLIPPA